MAVEIVTGDQIKDRHILKAATGGLGRTGKTRFATTAPLPIGLIPVDPNSIDTFKKAERENKALHGKVFYPKHEILKPEELQKMNRKILDTWTARQTPGVKAKEDLEKQILDFFRGKVNQINDYAYHYFQHAGISTLVIDGGQLWYEWAMFAHFGRMVQVMQRDRGPINGEMRDLWNSANKHLIVTHPLKPEYKNVTKDNGKVEGVATGKMLIDGWPHTHISANVCLEHFKLDSKDEVNAFKAKYRSLIKEDTERVDEGDELALYLEANLEEAIPIFGVKVYDCQANHALSRDNTMLMGDLCTFTQVAMRVYPGTTEADWK